jgi:hypothetical protein
VHASYFRHNPLEAGEGRSAAVGDVFNRIVARMNYTKILIYRCKVSMPFLRQILYPYHSSDEIIVVKFDQNKMVIDL